MQSKKTFEQLLKDKIATDLSQFIIDREIKMTNDINLYTKKKTFKGDEVVGIIQTGNGVYAGGNASYGITLPILIYFAVPLNYREEFLRYITDYATSENGQLVQELIDDTVKVYYFKTNYNTPTSDGIKRDVGGYEYIEVIIQGSIFYGDYEMTDDAVSIGANTLNNILSSSKSSTPIIEAFDIEGMASQFLVQNGATGTHTYRVLYKKGDTLHDILKGYVDDAGTLPNSVTVTINTQTYACKMTVSEELISGFRYLNITLQRTGTY